MGMEGPYREIVRPDRIVNTTLQTTMSMESREARDEVLESGMESGVIVSYDRLEEILSSQGAGKRNE